MISTCVTARPQPPNHQVHAHPPWLGQPPSWLQSTPSMLHCMYTCLLTSPSVSHPWSILQTSIPRSKPLVCPSPLPVYRHELAWPSQLSSTISACLHSQDKRHAAHTTTHAMISLNTKPKLNNLLTITHHTWAYIHHVFTTSLQISTIIDL
jgi:hypothetical protein